MQRWYSDHHLKWGIFPHWLSLEMSLDSVQIHVWTYLEESSRCWPNQLHFLPCNCMYRKGQVWSWRHWPNVATLTTTNVRDIFPIIPIELILAWVPWDLKISSRVLLGVKSLREADLGPSTHHDVAEKVWTRKVALVLQLYTNEWREYSKT